MDLGYLALLTITMSILLMMIQRTESRRRLLVAVLLIVPAILLRNFINYREIQTEGWVALGLALLLNFLFWVLIGRYNPVHSSDEIQVLGMDD
jgi:hypothetical protein